MYSYYLSVLSHGTLSWVCWPNNYLLANDRGKKRDAAQSSRASDAIRPGFQHKHYSLRPLSLDIVSPFGWYHIHHESRYNSFESTTCLEELYASYTFFILYIFVSTGVSISPSPYTFFTSYIFVSTGVSIADDGAAVAAAFLLSFLPPSAGVAVPVCAPALLAMLAARPSGMWMNS